MEGPLVVFGLDSGSVTPHATRFSFERLVLPCRLDGSGEAATG
jgi:hypothetical protein